MPLTGKEPFMRRYRATLVNGHEFYLIANEHHQAAEDAQVEANKLGAELKDVVVDDVVVPEEGGLDGDTLMWL